MHNCSCGQCWELQVNDAVIEGVNLGTESFQGIPEKAIGLRQKESIFQEMGTACAKTP